MNIDVPCFDHRLVQGTNPHRGNVKIVVATVLFGLGINIPDIRRSHLSYWQYVWRAGRDGIPSRAVVYPYGRSVVGDSGMREMFKSVECLRRSVLKTLLTKEMDESVFCVREGGVLKKKVLQDKRSVPIVLRKYVLTLRIVENDLSAVAVETGVTKSSMKHFLMLRV
ncbi:hypothetical protein DPMN_127988 [Dreissena polymorpha]|uniref:DNA 3'-5' helicase n=1 Tax=Dreissena polymorpha TaxID=45954 RepID=A0A9D4H264_DREPO|nr:hypothetical protein DPMN_127988 [Dreissena polymorpha]